jgi:hypothetical protein
MLHLSVMRLESITLNFSIYCKPFLVTVLECYDVYSLKCTDTVLCDIQIQVPLNFLI